MRTLQVAVPIDSSLRCVALVRGLPATRALMMTNGGASMVRLTWCKAMPAKRLEVVPAACLRHLRSLLKMRMRHIYTAHSRQSCALELPECTRPRILKQCRVRSYELRTPAAYSLVATDGFDQNAIIRFCAVRGPRTLMALDALAALARTLCSFNTPGVFFTDDGRISCVPYAYKGSYSQGRMGGGN